MKERKEKSRGNALNKEGLGYVRPVFVSQTGIDTVLESLGYSHSDDVSSSLDSHSVTRIQSSCLSKRGV